MINQIGNSSKIFIEGDSNIIDEDEEGNFSVDELRRRSGTVNKRNKSLDDFDGQQVEAPVN